MQTESEISVYAGRDPLGLIKAVAGGFEAFAADDGGELAYVGKAPNRREASDLILEHAARLGHARPAEERRAS